jgi:hypothetical protein
VNSSKKLFLAAAILAAGYGAAALCGRPNVAQLLDASPIDTSSRQPLAAASLPPTGSSSQLLTSPDGVKLVPDTSTDAKLQPISRDLPQPIVSQPEENPPALLATDKVESEARDSIYAFETEKRTFAEPRARLRDEAPRPLTNNPRARAAAPSIAPLGIIGPTRIGSAATSIVPQSSTTPSTYGFTTSINTQSASETAQRSDTVFPAFSAFDTRPTAAKLTPLPLLSSTETEMDEPRTHIVVDGDSLAKLAGRYLDDPRRADEILQLNRGLLSDPQLLPIGVELLIPPRAQDASISGTSPQSYLPRAVAIHSSRGGGLVPVRPIPAASTLTPRARLANPRNAE